MNTVAEAYQRGYSEGTAAQKDPSIPFGKVPIDEGERTAYFQGLQDANRKAD